MTTTTPVPVDNGLLAQRRTAVSNSTKTTGLDYVQYSAATSSPSKPAQLVLNFIPKSSGVSGLTIPAMTALNIQITLKTPSTTTGLSNFIIDSTFKTDDQNSPITAIAVPLSATSHINDDDNSIYTVSLVQGNSGDSSTLPLLNVDIFLYQSDFSILSNSQAQFDGLQSPETAVVTAGQAPEIDYLTRDYLSFRQLMLSRLSKLIPDWQASNEADLGSVIIEILAYAADYLSYYQDAVATESYLGTARSRVSVKRHARLLDYSISEGCNARVWAHIYLSPSATSYLLPAQTSLYSLGSLTPGAVPKGSDIEKELLDDPNVIAFATLYPVTLYPQRNEMSFYTWGSNQFSLAVGAINASLLGNFSATSAAPLQPGDVLAFAQVVSPDNKQAVDPTLRCVVRLETVKLVNDPLGSEFGNPSGDVTEITWSAQDALPFEILINNTLSDGTLIKDISKVYGNMVLADQGELINPDPKNSDDNPLIPNTVPSQGVYRPMLKQKNLTFYEPFNNDTAIKNGDGASQASQQNLQATIPAITLLNKTDNFQKWNAKQDLLDSNYLSQDFVIEVEDTRNAFIRFGDNQFGEQPNPGDVFTASYRVNNGSAGNIGADSLAYIAVSDTSLISNISNPLPAQGGTDPEPISQVKLYAPKAFAQQERCVTVEDYVAVTQHYSYRNEATGQDSNINAVNALLRWTGSWNTVFIAVALKGGEDFDDNFKQGLLNYLAGYQLMHHDIELIQPQWVPLTIALPVSVKTNYSANVVQYNLIQRFSSTTSEGFFYPDHFMFGQPVYLSNIVGAAMEVDGVASVNINDPQFLFQRFGESGVTAQSIDIGPLEIAQLNATVPGKGTIQFIMSMEKNS